MIDSRDIVKQAFLGYKDKTLGEGTARTAGGAAGGYAGGMVSKEIDIRLSPNNMGSKGRAARTAGLVGLMSAGAYAGAKAVDAGSRNSRRRDVADNKLMSKKAGILDKVFKNLNSNSKRTAAAGGRKIQNAALRAKPVTSRPAGRAGSVLSSNPASSQALRAKPVTSRPAGRGGSVLASTPASSQVVQRPRGNAPFKPSVRGMKGSWAAK